MKAILVVDMPDSCFHCPLESYRNQCGSNHKNTAGNANKRPSWCPLRPLPRTKAVDMNDYRDVMMFCHGWNVCLDEITGETE